MGIVFIVLPQALQGYLFLTEVVEEEQQVETGIPAFAYDPNHIRAII